MAPFDKGEHCWNWFEFKKANLNDKTLEKFRFIERTSLGYTYIVPLYWEVKGDKVDDDSDFEIIEDTTTKKKDKNKA